MKSLPSRALAGWIPLWLGFAVLAPWPVQAAVDFTISPVTISNTFGGTSTVTIT